MNTADIRSADVARMPDDELAQLFVAACETANAELQAACLAAAEKRDRTAAYWRALTARTDALRAEWRDAAYAQFLDAERLTRGNLVSRAGCGSPLTDAFRLWSGSERFAMAHASEELANFWLDHPRVTVTAYLAQHANAGQIHRDDMDRAELDAGQHTESEGGITDDGMARDETDSVRRDASAGQEIAAGSSDSGDHVVSGVAPGGAAPAGAGHVPPRNAGHVRGPVVMRDTNDGARVDISRGGVAAGYAFRTQVKAGGMFRWAWWGVRADGSMFLRQDKRAAVAAVLAA